MGHDRSAEFDGYVNEYRHHHNAGNVDALPAIKAEIDRVAAEVSAEADAKTAEAEAHEARGQHARAGQARQRSYELRTHLETAVANLPAELAVPPRKGGKAGTHAAD